MGFNYFAVIIKRTTPEYLTTSKLNNKNKYTAKSRVYSLGLRNLTQKKDRETYGNIDPNRILAEQVRGKWGKGLKNLR